MIPQTQDRSQPAILHFPQPVRAHAAPPPSMKVRQVCEIYIQHMQGRVQAGECDAQACEGVIRYINAFCDTAIEPGGEAKIGDKFMEECRKHDLTRFLQDHPTYKSNHTKKNALAAALRPFIWAEDEELIDKSPYRKSKKKF